MKIVIIGGVAAGLSAATKIKRENKEAVVTVYAKGQFISYGSCGLPYFLTDTIKTHTELISKDPERLKLEYGIQTHTNHEVIHVDSAKKQITVKDLSSNRTFVDDYDELVIATGAASVLPNVKGLDEVHCFQLRDLEDGIQLKAEILKPENKRVLVIGSGYIGLEVVEALSDYGKEVTLVNRSENLLKSYDQEVSDKILELLISRSVKLHLGEKLEEVGDKFVKTDKGTYEADIIVVALGNKPNTEFLIDTGIDMLSNGAIVVDSQMKTSLKNIYAAGDCATVSHLLKKKPTYIPLATNASKQGKILAQVLMGKNISMPPVLGSNAIKIFDYHFSKTGLSEKEAIEEGYNVGSNFVKAHTKPSYYPGSKAIFIKIIYEIDTHIVLGVQIFGQEDVVLRVDVFAACIFNKMTTEQIEYLDLCYAPPFSGVWDAINVSAGTVK